MIAVVAFGWVLLALPGTGCRRRNLLEPATEARHTAWSLAIGSGLVGFGLVSMSVPTLLDGVGAHHLAAFCRKVIHDVLAGGHLGGGAAALLMAVLMVRAVTGWRRIRRIQQAAVIEPWVGHHERAGANYELVVLPTTDFIALTVGGPVAQVVVSNGLVSALTDEELTMVVRHELAHLRGRHHYYLAMAAVVDAMFGWVPMVRSSTRTLRLALERSADEEAAGADPVARRVLYSALTAAARCLPQPGITTFGGIDMVLERLRALESSAPSDRTRWSRVAVGLVASTAASLWLFSVVVVGVSLASSEICYF